MNIKRMRWVFSLVTLSIFAVIITRTLYEYEYSGCSSEALKNVHLLYKVNNNQVTGENNRQQSYFVYKLKLHNRSIQSINEILLREKYEIYNEIEAYKFIGDILHLINGKNRIKFINNYCSLKEYIENTNDITNNNLNSHCKRHPNYSKLDIKVDKVTASVFIDENRNLYQVELLYDNQLHKIISYRVTTICDSLDPSIS